MNTPEQHDRPTAVAAARPLAHHFAWLRRPAAFEAAFCWYVLVCALDLMLTNFVINHAGAIEVNGVANRAIELAGFWGLIALKILTMLVVIGACEVLARQRRRAAVRLVEWAVAISAIPVVVTLAQLLAAL